MQDSEREALRKNRQALLKDLEAKKIASRLFSYNIFSVEDKDEVNSKETKNDQGEALLDILPRKGPKAFKAFCDALHDVSPHLESLLRPIQAEGMPTEGTDGGISTKKPIPSTINPGAAEKENQVEQEEQEIDHPQPPADICVCDDSIYRMAHQPRGIAVIINNKTFQEKTRQMSREGTDLDRDALKKLFHKLLFKLEVHNNKTSAEILEIVEKMSKLDHSNYDAFIFCILSHGEEGVVYGTDDTVPVEKITSRFTSTASLAGKPKIFFFQACQEHADQADAKLFSFGGSSGSKPSSNTLDTETVYKMDQGTRGIAIIINNKEFLRSSGMDRYPRNGTDVDRDGLSKLFRMLKFEVRVYNNRTKAEIRNIAKEMANYNHSNYNAFIFSILTHGEEGVIYGTDGTLTIKEITSEFKYSASLAGKPKLFFFQACQGHEYMDGMDVTDAPQDNRVSVPAEADFLYAYSTVPGYYSWRNSVNGSWFIQSLTKVFEDNAERMDILRMLTRVNAMVSTYKSRTGDYYSDSKRQVSSIVSMLRKELYFFPENIERS